jgi:phage terminase large subunit
MKSNEILTTEIFWRNIEQGNRFVVNQGGTRSGKTYALAQMFLHRFFTRKNYTLTISRKSFPALRGSVMRDIFDIMKEWGLYKEDNHKKTVNEYHLPERGNLIEFVSADEPQKMRGRKRTDLWLNEANEFSYEDFFQFNMRTTGQVYIDFNPSDSFHWIYDKLLTKPETECTFIHSTYKDNPFLAKEIVREIESLKDIDPEMYEVYALGKKIKPRETIFINWEVVKEAPRYSKMLGVGIDWGYSNDECACVWGLVNEPDNIIYLKEVFYDKGLSSDDILFKMKEGGIQKGFDIICDSSEPRMIDELKKGGFSKSRGVKKEAGSVLYGITEMK